MNGHCAHDYEIDKNDLKYLLYRSAFPFPAPGKKGENSFWFHGHRLSTESNTLESVVKNLQEVMDEPAEKMRQKGLAFHVSNRVTNKDCLESGALGLGGVGIPDGVDPELVKLYAHRKILEGGAKKALSDVPDLVKHEKWKTAIKCIDGQINGERLDEKPGGNGKTDQKFSKKNRKTSLLENLARTIKGKKGNEITAPAAWDFIPEINKILNCVNIEKGYLSSADAPMYQTSARLQMKDARTGEDFGKSVGYKSFESIWNQVKKEQE